MRITRVHLPGTVPGGCAPTRAAKRRYVGRGPEVHTHRSFNPPDRRAGQEALHQAHLVRKQCAASAGTRHPRGLGQQYGIEFEILRV